MRLTIAQYFPQEAIVNSFGSFLKSPHTSPSFSMKTIIPMKTIKIAQFFVVVIIIPVLFSFVSKSFGTKKPKELAYQKSKESPYLQRVRDLVARMEVFPIDFIARNGPLSNFEYRRSGNIYRVTTDSHFQFSSRAELTREPFRQFYEFCQLALDATPEDIDVCLDRYEEASPKEKALLMTIMYIYIFPWEKLDQFFEESKKHFWEQWEPLNEQLRQQEEQFWQQWEEQKELLKKDSKQFWEQREQGKPQEEFWKQFDLFTEQNQQQQEAFQKQLKQVVKELKERLDIAWYDVEGKGSWSWFSRQFASSFDLTIRKHIRDDSDVRKKACLAKIKESLDDDAIAFPAIVMELDEEMGSNEDMETCKASIEEILRIVKLNHNISSNEPMIFLFSSTCREYRKILCQKIREEYPNDSQKIIADMLYTRYLEDMFGPFINGLVRGNASTKPKTIGQIALHLLASWPDCDSNTPTP